MAKLKMSVTIFLSLKMVEKLISNFRIQKFKGIFEFFKDAREASRMKKEILEQFTIKS